MSTFTLWLFAIVGVLTIALSDRGWSVGATIGAVMFLGPVAIVLLRIAGVIA